MVRDYRPEDFEAVCAIHRAVGIDFRMPDLESPLFVVKKVVEIHGEVVACVAGRIEVETMLWLAPTLTPEQKMDAMEAMQPTYLTELWRMGIDNVVSWIEQAIEAKFTKRLRGLGWERDRDGWHSWSRNTSADGRSEGKAR